VARDKLSSTTAGCRVAWATTNHFVVFACCRCLGDAALHLLPPRALSLCATKLGLSRRFRVCLVSDHRGRCGTAGSDDGRCASGRHTTEKVWAASCTPLLPHSETNSFGPEGRMEVTASPKFMSPDSALGAGQATVGEWVPRIHCDPECQSLPSRLGPTCACVHRPRPHAFLPVDAPTSVRLLT
jgi:hypothetical protein